MVATFLKNTLSSVWKYLLMAAGLAMAVLAVLWRVSTGQRDKAREEAAEALRRAAAAAESLKISRTADRASQRERQHGQDIERKLEKDKASGRRPSGSFTDPRLRDDD